MKKIYYFAFGSNLLPERLYERVGPVPIKSTYKLKGWKLVFNCSGFANIVKGSATDFVEGVLYEFEPRHFEYLDLYEANYHRYYFDVDKTSLGCVYIAKKYHINNDPPMTHYVQIIMEGALRHNLMDCYKTAAKELPRSVSFTRKFKKRL